ncbi:MAG: undecaprenyldiphospho-muramoylpentapeptide beta-N-acetylglucosaminyltransferase [Proteobacteria bacterium]|nr:undecaprenyldiphospho-muramoylpentapeptide beta-N-acetylglucosaminyltransferase [Pseudomonadota bacterium]
MKRIIVTGGGTAGHVTPNMAMFPKLQDSGFDIHYIGQKTGIERDLVEPTGIPYHSISAGKLRRYIDLKNLTDIFSILKGFMESVVLVRKIRPSVVFSKGGFVSCPVVWAAWTCGIPVVIHESDITPGLANKLSMPFASRICYSFPETGDKLPGKKALYTGIPIRPMLLAGNERKGGKICGFTDSKPVVLIIGGSQGSEIINRNIRETLNDISLNFNICHICGKGGLNQNLDSKPGYRQFEYVDEELPHLIKVADVVVSRAGATTLFELLELKKANLLIPLSPKASRGDQILNAKSFKKQGFSRVLNEEDLDPSTLIQNIEDAYSRRNEMFEAMNAADTVNGLDKVLEVVENCATPVKTPSG